MEGCGRKTVWHVQIYTWNRLNSLAIIFYQWCDDNPWYKYGRAVQSRGLVKISGFTAIPRPDCAFHDLGNYIKQLWEAVKDRDDEESKK